MLSVVIAVALDIPWIPLSHFLSFFFSFLFLVFQKKKECTTPSSGKRKIQCRSGRQRPRTNHDTPQPSMKSHTRNISLRQSDGGSSVNQNRTSIACISVINSRVTSPVIRTVNRHCTPPLQPSAGKRDNNWAPFLVFAGSQNPPEAKGRPLVDVADKVDATDGDKNQNNDDR